MVGRLGWGSRDGAWRSGRTVITSAGRWWRWRAIKPETCGVSLRGDAPGDGRGYGPSRSPSSRPSGRWPWAGGRGAAVCDPGGSGAPTPGRSRAAAAQTAGSAVCWRSASRRGRGTHGGRSPAASVDRRDRCRGREFSLAAAMAGSDNRGFALARYLPERWAKAALARKGRPVSQTWRRGRAKCRPRPVGWCLGAMRVGLGLRSAARSVKRPKRTTGTERRSVLVRCDRTLLRVQRGSRLACVGQKMGGGR